MGTIAELVNLASTHQEALAAFGAASIATTVGALAYLARKVIKNGEAAAGLKAQVDALQETVKQNKKDADDAMSRQKSVIDAQTSDYKEYIEQKLEDAHDEALRIIKDHQKDIERQHDELKAAVAKAQANYETTVRLAMQGIHSLKQGQVHLAAMQLEQSKNELIQFEQRLAVH